MDTTQTIAQLQAANPTSMVKRIAIPIEAGLLSPIEELKTYLLTKGLKYTLTKTGGFITRRYVLVVTDVTALDALQLVRFLVRLEEVS